MASAFLSFDSVTSYYSNEKTIEERYFQDSKNEKTEQQSLKRRS